MRPRDLETLEFPKLLDALARLAASSTGAERCRELMPATDLPAVERRLATLAEYLRLSADHPQGPQCDVPDLRPLLALAAHDGAVLDGRELLAVLTTLRLATAVRRYLRRAEPGARGLASIAARLTYPPEVERTLARAIDETGRIREDATPELAGLRAMIRSLREELEARLQHLLAEADREIATERYVTLRNNRFVVPVRTGAAHRIAGVIQDRSASGETVFLEPLFAVELNNRLVLAHKEEEAEERRICAHVTREIRKEGEAITAVFEAVVDCDVLAASAALARRLDATIAVVGTSDMLLRRCRHPLLVLGARPVTPIDLLLQEGCRGLVVTGPNTGGKTVALKTIGLLALMAQSGLAIPAADGSELPCFGSVYADIGDAQSIERNLSTFSSHVENLAEIAVRADAQSLVLLDEPGVGTDPDEGAALAVGVLGHLRERGARVAASSHSGEVKTFALAEPAFDVAAVDVDPTTFEPRYRLRYHTLGQSLGLPMARRLGLPEPIIAAAEGWMKGTAGSDVALAAERLDKARQAYDAGITAVETERAALAASREEYAALVADLEASKQEAWQEAISAAHKFVQDLRVEGRQVLEDIRRAGGSSTTLRRAVATQEKAIAEAAASHAASPISTETSLSIGDEVEVLGQGIRGELVELKGERARIRRGALRFEVPAGALHRVNRGSVAGPDRPSGQPTGQVTTDVRVVDVPEVGEVISLIGLRAQEAIRRLEEFLDRAVRAGVPAVEIVHGVGTGALRRAVHDFLETSPYCTGFHEGRPGQGGYGVTIADLAT